MHREIRNVCKILVGKPEGLKRSLRRTYLDGDVRIILKYIR